MWQGVVQTGPAANIWEDTAYVAGFDSSADDALTEGSASRKIFDQISTMKFLLTGLKQVGSTASSKPSNPPFPSRQRDIHLERGKRSQPGKGRGGSESILRPTLQQFRYPDGSDACVGAMITMFRKRSRQFRTAEKIASNGRKSRPFQHQLKEPSQSCMVCSW